MEEGVTVEARKIKEKLVLQLRNQGLSRRAIESAEAISRPMTQALIDAVQQLGLGSDDVTPSRTPRCLRRCSLAAVSLRVP